MKIGVTGGNGLLGGAAVRGLVDRGHDAVSIDLVERLDHIGGIEQRVADVRSPQQLHRAVRGLDAVIHTASLIDLHLGRPAALREVNVLGAQNVIDACRRNGVGRLVHMSSAEVITGTTPLRGVTEADASYPAQHLTYYGVTKQAGEEAVLAAADESLGTCAMRTFGLFGPGDNTVVPMFLASMPTKRIMTMGNRSAKTDVVHAPNLAHGLVLAAERLEPGLDWSGTPFHVTDHEPVNIQTFLATLVEPFGYQRLDRPTIPRRVVSAVARFYERRYQLTRSERFARPVLTDHRLRLTLDDYWLDSSRATDILGYHPPVSRDAAIESTRAWLEELLAKR